VHRTAAGLCVATAMVCAVTLGAQTPTTTPQRSSTTTEHSHDVTVTGCLARDAGGSFTLNDARIDSSASATTTTAGSTTTAGATTTTTPSASTSSGPAMTWLLIGGTDLDKHVGHKMQVTGKTIWDSSMSRSSATTAAQPDPTTTAGTTGTLEQRRGDRAKGAEPHLDVQSIEMIASSCS